MALKEMLVHHFGYAVDREFGKPRGEGQISASVCPGTSRTTDDSWSLR